MATLVPCLVELRATFNQAAPGRDKSSDGWIGDAAHRASSSDHNPDETGTVPIRDADSVDEVHAIDVDDSGPWPVGLSMMAAVRRIVENCRAGREDRLRYVIYERTIWSASWGWGAREYTGANPHDKHAHFSASYEAAKERDTRPWDIGWPAGEDEDMELTPENLRQIGQACWAFRPADHPVGPDGKPPTAHSIMLNGHTRKLDGMSDTLSQIDAALVSLASDGDEEFVAWLREAVGTERAARIGALLAGGPQ